jgi:Zn-dependent protease with chaperone function
MAGAALAVLLVLTAARILLHPLLCAYSRRQELQAGGQ